MTRVWLQCLALLLALPAANPAFGQGTGNSTIAGVVKASSGAVLPGVTVEAASPGLIEGTRATVTDERGEYRVLDLRPGAYSVTFALPGFNTLKRNDIQLPPSFTATLNVELDLGAMQETVTVSGGAPLIDTQNMTQQKVISKEVLDAVPTARSALGIAALMPSVVEPPNALTPGIGPPFNKVFNGSSVVNFNSTFGPLCLQPTQILDARLVKFSAQFDF
jgi:hypothetical protein